MYKLGKRYYGLKLARGGAKPPTFDLLCCNHRIPVVCTVDYILCVDSPACDLIPFLCLSNQVRGKSLPQTSSLHMQSVVHCHVTGMQRLHQHRSKTSRTPPLVYHQRRLDTRHNLSACHVTHKDDNLFALCSRLRYCVVVRLNFAPLLQIVLMQAED